jgi:hypothetical protein
MAKPLQQGPSSPPLPVFVETPDLMIHHFRKTKQPVANPAYAYAYDTFGAQGQSLVGAGTGLKRQGIRAITIPLVSMPVLTVQGIGGNNIQPGNFSVTPATEADGSPAPGFGW